MDTDTIVSRRSLLKHTPIAVVATALPAIAIAAPSVDATAGLFGLPLAAVHIERAVEAMAEPGLHGRWSVTIHSGDVDQYWGFRQEHDEVARAISLHKRAYAAFSAAIDHEEAVREGLRANARYPNRPSVQYGYYRQLGGEERTPLFAFSLKELDELCEKDCHSRGSIWGQPGIDRTRERYASLKRDLSSQIRRQKRMERLAGAPAARRDCLAASKAEERAAMAVLLVKPRSDAERQAKVRYMRGKNSFKFDYWDAEGVIAALKHHLEMAGA